MKKEKQIRTYQRRTKSGKMVTVKAHTATYDAAEKAKEAAKKKGAGKELESRKNAKEEQLEIPFDWKDEKKVLDEVKDTAKKESTKKPAEGKTTEKKTTKTEKNVTPYNKAKVGDYVKGVGELSTGKVVRVKSDIPAKFAKSYAESEGIPLKQAYQELMVASKGEYRRINSFHNGGTISPKKVRPVGSGTNGPTPKEKPAKTTSKSDSSAPAFTAAEFKEWYNGTGSAADKKVAKALRAQLGRAGYRKLEDEAIDNYTPRGHNRMFKSLGSMGGNDSSKKKSSKVSESTGTSVRKPASTKMPDKVREKKRKHEEYLRKVKESGMGIDEYSGLH